MIIVWRELSVKGGFFSRMKLNCARQCKVHKVADLAGVHTVAGTEAAANSKHQSLFEAGIRPGEEVLGRCVPEPHFPDSLSQD